MPIRFNANIVKCYVYTPLQTSRAADGLIIKTSLEMTPVAAYARDPTT